MIEEEDEDRVMTLIDPDTYGRVKAYAFAQIFSIAKAKAADGTQKPTARDFIKHLKRSLPKDLRVDTALVENELKIADMARRVKNNEQRRLEFDCTYEETQ